MGDHVVKVLLVGDYPPPYGGLSVQVSALRHRLSSRPGYSCRVLDIGESRRQRRPECVRSRNALDFVGKLLWHAVRQYVIHLHMCGHNSSSWLAAFACAMAGLCNGRKTVLSIGSGLAADWLPRAGWLARLAARATLALTGVTICRNERMQAAVAALGASPGTTVVLPGFYGLPPRKPASVSPQVETFLHRHSPVIGALASVGPEYGLPLVAEAAARLRTTHPGTGLLLIGPATVESPDLGPSLLVTGALPHPVALALMRRMNVFVRPTYFDGDASSVREALALGVPVVASDTDFRPEGVVLFRRGCVDDLTDKIVHTLGQQHAKGGRGTADQGSWPQLRAIYEQLTRPARSSAGGIRHRKEDSKW
jgi:glycogen synthase